MSLSCCTRAFLALTLVLQMALSAHPFGPIHTPSLSFSWLFGPVWLAPLLNCSLVELHLSAHSLSPVEGGALWRCLGSFVFVPFCSFTGAAILTKILDSRLMTGAARLRSINLRCFLCFCPYSSIISQALCDYELSEDGDCLSVVYLCSAWH